MEYFNLQIRAKRNRQYWDFSVALAVQSNQTISRQIKVWAENHDYELIKVHSVKPIDRHLFLQLSGENKQMYKTPTCEYFLLYCETDYGPARYPVFVHPHGIPQCLTDAVQKEQEKRNVHIVHWTAEPISQEQYNELAGIQVEDERPELPPIKAILNLYANQYHWNPETQIQLLLGFIEEYPTTEYTRNDFVNYLNIEVSIQWKNVDGPNYPMTPNEYKETPIITD